MGATYRCETCGAAFDRPASLRRSQRMPDGYWERQVYRVCPVCGGAETDFEALGEPDPGNGQGNWPAPGSGPGPCRRPAWRNGRGWR